MKEKIIVLVMSIVLLCSTSFAYANDSINRLMGSIEQYDMTNQMKKMMSYDEALQELSSRKGISLEDAARIIGADNSKGTNSVMYTSYDVEIIADQSSINRYRPTVEFWCQLSGVNGSWRIDNVYDIEMNRNYNGIVKRFDGEISAYVQNSGARIQYFVNGDFYNTGSQSVSGGITVGIDGFKVSFSITNMSNYYSYVYTNGYISKTGVVS